MEVDDMMEVVCLSPDESWELFQRKVGEIPLKSHQDIPELARRVAEKCCGLPLALSVIGKAMACKESVQEWQHAINVLNSSSQKFPGMEEKVLSILRFSYDSLEDEKVKLCFLYCSLFLEDCQLDKEELIEYWICEGFIDGKRDKDEPNYQGHDIIGSLVRAHLLMDGKFTTRVKMHDVIREMALWIASNFGKQKERLCVKSGAQLRMIPKDINWEMVRKMSLVSNRIVEISCSPNCPKLSTLLLRKNNTKERGSPCTNSSGFKNLVAVDIVNLEGPRDLTWLLYAQNLRDLYVERSSGIEEIINREKGMSISNVHLDIDVPFKKLEFLKVSRLSELKSISWNPPALPNLREFVSVNCPKLSIAAREFPGYVEE